MIKLKVKGVKQLVQSNCDSSMIQEDSLSVLFTRWYSIPVITLFYLNTFYWILTLQALHKRIQNSIKNQRR